MRIDKFTVLKFIDHWVGGPICIALVLFYRLTHPGYKTYTAVPADELPVRNVMIMKFVGIGSLTLASSIALDIKAQYKDAKIYFMTFKSNEEILNVLGVADKVIAIDTGNPVSLVSSIISALAFCHREKIDVSMDIEFYSKFSTMMAFLSGARWRMGFYLGRFWRNSLIDIPINFNYSRHIMQIYAMFSKALGVDDCHLKPKEIDVSDEQKAGLLEELKKYQLTGLNETITLNIHASDLALARRWPIKHFAVLVDMISKEYPQRRIILTGVKGEMAYSREFVESISPDLRSRIIDLTGKLSLKQFLALLAQTPLFVTNDSGPLHLANAVGGRTISLWGPSSVVVHGFLNMDRENEDFIYKRYPCSPCIYIYRTNAGYFCKGKAPCMEEIKPDEVMTLVRKKLH